MFVTREHAIRLAVIRVERSQHLLKTAAVDVVISDERPDGSSFESLAVIHAVRGERDIPEASRLVQFDHLRGNRLRKFEVGKLCLPVVALLVKEMHQVQY